jgi:hypothetical protein
VIDEVLDELACGLLGDPEVLGHVGSGRITFTDPRKRETMCRANIVKATEREALLYPVHKLACEAQYRNGRLPAVACHDHHLDML